MGNETVWNLVEEGRFQEACEKADEEYSQTGSEFPLRNKVSALLLLNKHQEAIALCELLIRMTAGNSEHDFIRCGIALWLAGARENAVRVWEEAQSVKRYTDAAGGLKVPLLLHYAAVKLNDAVLARRARTRIASRCRDRRAINWPGPIGAYALGELDEQELLARVDPQPILRVRQSCQVFFWIGVASVARDPARAWDMMRKAIEFVPNGYLEGEYYLAKGEVDNIDRK